MTCWSGPEGFAQASNRCYSCAPPLSSPGATPNLGPASARLSSAATSRRLRQTHARLETPIHAHGLAGQLARDSNLREQLPWVIKVRWWDQAPRCGWASVTICILEAPKHVPQRNGPVPREPPAGEPGSWEGSHLAPKQDLTMGSRRDKQFARGVPVEFSSLRTTLADPPRGRSCSCPHGKLLK